MAMGKRAVLTIREKREICAYSDQHAKTSHQAIASHFSLLLGKTISRRCVGGILSEKEKWFREEVSSRGTRIRPAKHEELEDALTIWTSQVNAKHGSVTEAMIIEQAKVFGEQMEITDFQYSPGWLARFKKRRGLSQHIRQGETAEVDNRIVSEGREKLAAIIDKFELRDVYNVDESGLYYRMQPDKTISCGPVKGCKKAKDRITLVFCANADGSDKRTVTVIGKAASPKCFKNFKPSLYVNWRHNKKAWMTAIEFSAWLKEFNESMRRQKRHVLLLMDNAPCHKVEKLTNVTIEFLPPNCTGILQPLDAGIIKCFKAHYRRHQVKHIIGCINSDQPISISMKDALFMIRRAWDEVKPDAIRNCWSHTGLIPPVQAPVDEDEATKGLKDALEEFQTHVSLEHPLTAKDFATVDDELPTFEEMETDDILQLVWNGDHSYSEEEEVDAAEEHETPTSAKEASHSMKQVRAFLEKHCDNPDVMSHVIALTKVIEEIGEEKKTQSLISDFFKSC